MELIFATHNRHKLQEAVAIAGASCVVKGLDEIGCFEEIPETADSLLGNATQKVDFVCQRFPVNCFADDTGLVIEALDGRPGVYSARYAGPDCSPADNIRKVLREMEGITHRKACFKTVIALVLDGQHYFFEGRVDGEILTECHGASGFGYDPIFRPDGFTTTFAEMSEDEKNRISHRGRALQQMIQFLKNR
ncbi:MAG: RdgB/HAM1 family non-canonical purine NTP pyrophosphatase [Bacteroidales bacterium]|nr:RdgB/HAM1 family non-canonical purine NTP pyrophosphatase [Bacteroidales bacterium]